MEGLLSFYYWTWVLFIPFLNHFPAATTLLADHPLFLNLFTWLAPIFSFKNGVVPGSVLLVDKNSHYLWSANEETGFIYLHPIFELWVLIGWHRNGVHLFAPLFFEPLNLIGCLFSPNTLLLFKLNIHIYIGELPQSALLFYYKGQLFFLCYFPFILILLYFTLFI